MDAVAGGFQLVGNLGGREALGGQATGKLDQDALAHADVKAVNHAHVALGLGRSDHRALVGARELGRKGDDHGLVAGGVGAVERLAKGIGVDLARCGQLVAFDQQLVEALVSEVDAVLVGRLTKGDGQRQDVDVGVLARQDVGARIGNDAHGHKPSLDRVFWVGRLFGIDTGNLPDGAAD